MTAVCFPRDLALGKIRSEDKTHLPAGQSSPYLEITTKRSAGGATAKEQVSVCRARSASGSGVKGESGHRECGIKASSLNVFLPQAERTWRGGSQGTIGKGLKPPPGSAVQSQ